MKLLTRVNGPSFLDHPSWTIRYLPTDLFWDAFFHRMDNQSQLAAHDVFRGLGFPGPVRNLLGRTPYEHTSADFPMLLALVGVVVFRNRHSEAAAILATAASRNLRLADQARRRDLVFHDDFVVPKPPWWKVWRRW
jgi:hypothetical protein